MEYVQATKFEAKRNGSEENGRWCWSTSLAGVAGDIEMANQSEIME